MVSESQEKKALTYLAEGRIKAISVTATGAEFRCEGTEVYTTHFYPGVGWACTCPARKAMCAHVYAARLVTDLHVDPADVHLTDNDPELDDLLGVQ